MKSFWIGGALGFILGTGLTFLYFSLATLFSVHKTLTLEASQSELPFNEPDRLAAESQSDNAKGVGA